MEDTFKESVVEKINQVEKQVHALSGQAAKSEEIRQQQKALSAEIGNFKTVVLELKQDVKLLPAVASQLTELSPKLEHCTKVLNNPPRREDHHIHHFRWPLGVAIGLLLLLIASIGWISHDQQKMSEYIANDTKYRFLKVNSTGRLKAYIYDIDSLYHSNDNMRSKVLQQQKDEQERLKLLQKAKAKEEAAKELRQKAEKDIRHK